MKIKTIRTKIIIYLLINFIVLGSIGSLINFIVSDNILSYIGSKYNGEILNNNKIKVLKTFDLNINFSNYLADNPVIKSWLKNETNDTYRELSNGIFNNAKGMIGNANIFIAFDDSKNFYFNDFKNALGEPLSKDDPDDSWYFDTIENGFNLNIDYNNELETQSMWVNVPVYNDDDAPLGVIGTGIEITELIDGLIKDIEENSEIIIFNNEGIIKVHKDSSLLDTSNIYEIIDNKENYIKAKITRLDDKDLVSGNFNYEGIDYIGSISRLESVGWNIMILTNINFLSSRISIPFILLLIGMMIAVIITFIIFTNRIIIKPVKKVNNIIIELSKGYLNKEIINMKSKDEIGQLSKAINNFISNITQVIYSVRTATESFVSATDEISAGNQDLSQRVSEQSANLEQTTVAVQEISETIKTTTDKTLNTRELMGKLKESMIELADSSKQMEDIINIINDISFQTNLLALNASIEASRAGEKGKGFEVVAVEVKELSEKASVQAKEITAIIKKNVTKIDESTTTIENIVDTINEIASSSKEQKDRISDINYSIEELNKVTQENASLVEESAAASEEITSQAKELNNKVKFFKINKESKKLAEVEKEDNYAEYKRLQSNYEDPRQYSDETEQEEHIKHNRNNKEKSNVNKNFKHYGDNYYNDNDDIYYENKPDDESESNNHKKSRR
ncbi:MAG: methyl-accepting chemotaxis protein [Spirochaetota bacterium]